MALENLQRERIKKLQNIKKLGVDPYPAKTSRKQTTLEAQKMLGKKVAVVGRIRSLRPHGKITFADIEDASGKMQLFFSQAELPGEKYEFLVNLDLGDFLQVEGEVFKTQAGEVTIRVSSFQLLTKSLRPLPSAWYGLKDVEERNRRRYLDMLMNSEVKSVFEKRSQIVHYIRKFLIEEKGYLEVETPILQPIYGGGRAKPFKTHHNTLDVELYLRIASELYLKRLIAGGMEKVFEISKVFRNEGMDRNHNPEFTLLETMEAYADYMDNMNLVEEMFEYVAIKVFGKTKLTYQGTVLDFKRPWARVRLADLFKQHAGVSFHEIDTLEKAVSLAKKLGVEIHDYMTDGEILLEIFEKKCTDQLIQPTFVYDYPRDFVPLAKIKADDPKFVESFDIYVAGMEMGSNWSEQNDPQVLKEAWEKEKKKAAKGNPEAQKMDEDFLEALEYGMPPTSGIGPGIDRWVMVMTDSPSISDVILFPTLRPEKNKNVKPGGSSNKIKLSKSNTQTTIKRDQALEFINQKVANKNIVKHMLATEAVMRALARELRVKSSELRDEEFNEEEWGLAGLLHDGDYSDTVPHERQGIEVSKWLEDEGFQVSEEIKHAMAAHNCSNTKIMPESKMDWSLFCSDSLTGLIVASALVLPEKKLSNLTVESVLKRFKEPKFAAGTRREDILMCENHLGTSLEEFVKISLEAMQGIAPELGL